MIARLVTPVSNPPTHKERPRLRRPDFKSELKSTILNSGCNGMMMN